MKFWRRAAMISAALWSAILPFAARADSGFYQYPVAHGETLVFASEGDLWRAETSGGTAIRLTNHLEEESYPRISPDGQQIAFNAAYDSAGDIYVMPLAGGAPRRLTFAGGGVRTIGWTPDGKVLFLSRLEKGGFTQVLYSVDPRGGDPVAIPLSRVQDATFGSDGQTLFFTRRGIGASNDNAVQYRGGGMGQLWRWQLGTSAEAVRLLADFGGPVSMPMAHGGRIYFVSDQSGGDAIWSVAEDGSGVRRESDAMPFPIRQASLDGDRIFLQNGADIYVFGLADKALRKLDLQIITDRAQTRVRALDKPLRFFTGATIAPSGQSVAVTARGRVALGFPRDRRRVELPVPLDARARQAQVSPDGKTVFLLLDKDLAGGVFRMPADGSGPPVAIIKDYASHIWNFEVSPDGKTIVFADKAARLQKLDVASGAVTLLAQNKAGGDQPFTDVRFSPDGRTIAYSEDQDGGAAPRGVIVVQSLSDGRRVEATSRKYNDTSPAFSADGRWLYFVSERNFDPRPGNPWGDRNMGVSFPDRGEIYAVQLDPAADFPFSVDTELTAAAKPASDDSAATSDAATPDKAKADEGKADRKGKKPAPANVVMDGLAARLYKVPGATGITGSLLVAEKHLLAMRGEDELISIAISKDDPKIETFAKSALGASLSADRKTVFLVTGPPETLALLLVPAGEKLPEKLDPNRVRLADWRLQIDPREEWHQMFLDAWRLHRDFAYDPKLRSVDWNAVRARLEPFVARIGHRTELNAILSEMSWSLGILHSQIGPGEVPVDSKNPDMGYLGARLAASAGGGMRITQINDSDPDIIALRAPLKRPGVDVREGDVIVRIDGAAIASQADVARALAGKVGQEVRLDLTRGGVARSAIIKPVSFVAEIGAEYRDRVIRTRAAVDRLSGGKIGYVALAAMVEDDVAEFARDFYGQSEREGMIIDVRDNNGGNVDSMIIGALLRRAWAFWAAPGGKPYTNMQGAYRGPIAVLIDEQTYSDGETFAAGIKSLGIAPLIGQRTAGAGIWLTGRPTLTDNGIARIAEFAQYRLDGEWLIEGWGVEPDIAVDNAPHASFTGSDAQLQAAIDYLKDRLATQPAAPLVPRPLPPVGTPAKSPIPLPRP
ncbi:MAG: PD40 domain-containing protein [Sphingomonadales bacterium]|nr:PD40 domain-containing protein [Sphingomonadales bacterium]